MRYLHSFVFCPLSRKISFALKEKNVEFTEIIEDMTSPSDKFLSTHKMADIPTFIDHRVVCPNTYSACEYIEEVYQKPTLIPGDAGLRAEIRQIVCLFDQKFYHDVYLTIFYEKTLKKILSKKSPDTRIIKQGHVAMKEYLKYTDSICDIHKFIACDFFSFADITVASHISCIDYLGDIQWSRYPSMKEWYMKIKSRPSFSKILSQTFPGIGACSHYTNLDF